MPHDLLEDAGRVAEERFVLRHLKALGDDCETLEVHLKDDGED